MWAPRIVPPRARPSNGLPDVMTLMTPSGRHAITARSTAVNGSVATRTLSPCVRRASGSVRPTCAISGSVKTTHGITRYDAACCRSSALCAADADTEVSSIRRGVPHGCRLDQRFRRHASIPSALAAQRPVADQEHASFEARRGLCGREPRRPSPDDGEVEGVAHAGFGPPANTRHALWPPNPNDVVIASRALTARPTLGT